MNNRNAGPGKIGRATRRTFNKLLLAGAMSASLLGDRSALAQARKGGRLRVATAAGSAGDTLDPAKSQNESDIFRVSTLYSKLLDFNPGVGPVPALATEWEPVNGGQAWVFRLRQGVEFHNAKTLDSADVVFSLNRIRNPDTASPVASLLTDVVDITADGPTLVRIDLAAANADFPALLTEYHFRIVPDGTENPSESPIGTGAWRVKEFRPGISSLFERHPNYWKDGLPYVDEVEIFPITDPSQRANALIAGEVDMIMNLDPRLVSVIDASDTTKLFTAPSGSHVCYPMTNTMAPFNDVNVRRALKYSFDRKRFIQIAFGGYGVVGNDHPVPPFDPYYCKDLPVPEADPDKVNFYLRQAGLQNANFELTLSDAVYGGVSAGAILAELMRANGVNLTVKRTAADGYWTAIPGKVPLYATYYFGRPSADAILSLVYLSSSGWNEPQWKNPGFDSLIAQARAELEPTKRKELYCEAQRILKEDGPSIIPIFYDWLDAISSSVRGLKPHPHGSLGGANWDDVWIDA